MLQQESWRMSESNLSDVSILNTQLVVGKIEKRFNLPPTKKSPISLRIAKISHLEGTKRKKIR